MLKDRHSSRSNRSILDLLLSLLAAFFPYLFPYLPRFIRAIRKISWRNPDQRYLNILASILLSGEKSLIDLEKSLYHLYCTIRRLKKFFIRIIAPHGPLLLTNERPRPRTLVEVIKSHPEVFEWREENGQLFIKLRPNWEKYVKIDPEMVNVMKILEKLSPGERECLAYLREPDVCWKAVWHHLEPILRALKEGKATSLIEHVGILRKILLERLPKAQRTVNKYPHLRSLVVTPHFHLQIQGVIRDFAEVSSYLISMMRRIKTLNDEEKEPEPKSVPPLTGQEVRELKKQKRKYHSRASTYARKICKLWNDLREKGYVTERLDEMVKNFLIYYKLEEKTKLQQIKLRLEKTAQEVVIPSSPDELFQYLDYHQMQIWVVVLFKNLIKSMVKVHTRRKKHSNTSLTEYMDSIEFEILSLLFDNPAGLSENEIAEMLHKVTGKSVRSFYNHLNKVLPELEKRKLVRDGKHRKWKLNF